ncbi:MAG: helix-turn-helix domain-containing protein [Anaerolineae bacterium]|nr:helix-turn-helix domain-containing protein [Anaerolineae bacterium]
MSLIFEERPSDSPYVDMITQGRTLSEGSTIRPAECHWHMVFVKENGNLHPLVVGPWTSAGVTSWGGEAEILWVRFKLGTFIPHLPSKKLLNTETALPEASSSNKFWLKSCAWQFPDFDNIETFIDRLARDEVLVCDPVVDAALQDQLPEMSSRTVRHRFSQTIGLSQNHIRQVERAKYAAQLLEQGVSILDTVYEAGYFDQPHLTRSLKQYIGYTPAQIFRTSQADCHSVQDDDLLSGYHTNVLEEI